MYFGLGGNGQGSQQARAHCLEPCLRGRRQTAVRHRLGEVVHLPQEETEERWKLTTPQWPVMHAILKGVGRDQMMARHQSNHIQVVYAPDAAKAKRGCTPGRSDA